jgi:hypothetical protein
MWRKGNVSIGWVLCAVLIVVQCLAVVFLVSSGIFGVDIGLKLGERQSTAILIGLNFGSLCLAAVLIAMYIPHIQNGGNAGTVENATSKHGAVGAYTPQEPQTPHRSPDDEWDAYLVICRELNEAPGYFSYLINVGSAERYYYANPEHATQIKKIYQSRYTNVFLRIAGKGSVLVACKKDSGNRDVCDVICSVSGEYFTEMWKKYSAICRYYKEDPAKSPYWQKIISEENQSLINELEIVYKLLRKLCNRNGEPLYLSPSAIPIYEKYRILFRNLNIMVTESPGTFYPDPQIAESIDVIFKLSNPTESVEFRGEPVPVIHGEYNSVDPLYQVAANIVHEQNNQQKLEVIRVALANPHDLTPYLEYARRVEEEYRSRYQNRFGFSTYNDLDAILNLIRDAKVWGNTTEQDARIKCSQRDGKKEKLGGE